MDLLTKVHRCHYHNGCCVLGANCLCSNWMSGEWRHHNAGSWNAFTSLSNI